MANVLDADVARVTSAYVADIHAEDYDPENDPRY
jgi:hypothetical protein